MIGEEAGRVKVTQRKTAGTFFSEMTLMDINYLDVGKILCYFEEQSSLSDSIYMFVKSKFYTNEFFVAFKFK